MIFDEWLKVLVMKKAKLPFSCGCGGDEVALCGTYARSFRSQPGTVKLPALTRVRCPFCGRRFVPLLEMAGFEKCQTKTVGAEKAVVEQCVAQSYRRAEKSLNSLTGLHLDHSTCHRWVLKTDADEIKVPEDGRLFGIVSVNDIINALDNGWIDDKCEDHMASNLVVLEAGMPLAYALRYFNNYTYGRFPVLDASRKLVGIISQRDVMKALLYELSVEIRKLERKAARASSNTPEHVTSENYFRKEFAVVHNDLGSAGRAANEIKQILKERKIDRTVARRVAIAAYELEINVCIHSHGGILTFILDDNTITIKTKDRGPGIPDIEWACRDGASTANDWIRSMGFGAGMGLPNSKRVSDKFEIESEVGKYTKVTCTFNLEEVKEQGK